MTLKTVQENLLKVISPIYGEGEARAICTVLLEHLTGMNSVEQVMHSHVNLGMLQLEKLEKFQSELIDRKPLQYILEECWFMDFRLYVNGSVLIPRPETEELADWMIRELKNMNSPSILDVGTGSGCLALALKKHLSKANVLACDVSLAALDVASKNAEELGLEIDFFQFDLLNFESICPFPVVDVIVSNPPYIPLADCSKLDAHVVNYEPHLALFSPTEDPLLFYKAIGKLAIAQLKEGGTLYLELHAPYAQEIIDLYTGMGFEYLALKKDMQGLERMLKVKRSPRV